MNSKGTKENGVGLTVRWNVEKKKDLWILNRRETFDDERNRMGCRLYGADGKGNANTNEGIVYEDFLSDSI